MCHRMTEDSDADWHPDDEKADRLLARFKRARANLRALQNLPPTDDEKKKRARERDADLFRGERDEVYQALFSLPYADPNGTWPSDRNPTPLPLPLLPGPPSWRTSLLSYHGAEAEAAERARADAIIKAAARDALAVLRDRLRAEGPRITAMQIFDHHVARDEVTLPPYALELFARAVPIDPREIEALEHRAVIARGEAEDRSQKAIAKELGITRRAVGKLRDRPPSANAALYAAVAAGGNLRVLRPQVAAALGLIDTDTGCWRTTVLETIRGGGAGARTPGRVREAARVEAQRRQSGLQPNDAKRLSIAFGIGVATVRRMIARADWERVVAGEAIWLRGGLRARPHEWDLTADL